VGGSAAGAFTPHTVQCHNVGWDGQDVQWECKTDMEGDFRFGQIDVICEGYDYPDDPYILKGSCGLEYTLDYTREGSQRKNHDYYGGGGASYGSNYHHTYHQSNKWSGLNDLLLLGVAGLVIYAFYRTCLAGQGHEYGDRTYSSTNDDYGYPGGNNPGGGGWHTPGYNNRPGHGGGGGGFYDNADCQRRPGRQGGGAGGFWTGMATGGLMGYMFGNRG